MIKLKKVTPLHNMIITTMNKYEGDEIKTGNIIDANKINNPIKEYQKVLAVGPIVRNIEVGDTVMINLKRYAVKKFQEGSIKEDIQGYNQVLRYNCNTITINDKECLILYDSDIDFIIEDYEEQKEEKKEDNSSKIILPKKGLIL